MAKAWFGDTITDLLTEHLLHAWPWDAMANGKDKAPGLGVTCSGSWPSRA